MKFFSYLIKNTVIYFPYEYFNRNRSVYTLNKKSVICEINYLTIYRKGLIIKVNGFRDHINIVFLCNKRNV